MRVKDINKSWSKNKWFYRMRIDQDVLEADSTKWLGDREAAKEVISLERAFWHSLEWWWSEDVDSRDAKRWRSIWGEALFTCWCAPTNRERPAVTSAPLWNMIGQALIAEEKERNVKIMVVEVMFEVARIIIDHEKRRWKNIRVRKVGKRLMVITILGQRIHKLSCHLNH